MKLDMRQRVFLGSAVRVTHERPDGVELEGNVRLRPGCEVDVVISDNDGNGGPAVRAAVVASWDVTRIGRAGPTFRGVCRWR